MNHIESPVEGMERIQDFLLNRTAATPDDVHEKLRELIRPGTSPVVASVEAAELIYARREDLPPELLELGAQLSTMCAMFNFHGLAEEGRGTAMAATIRAMDNVASVSPELPPAPEEPPAPKEQYLLPTEEPEEPVVASPEPAPAAPPAE